MYEPHFGLRPRPFAETADPSAFVALPSREAALRRLRFGLERGSGPVALVGPAGTGKSIVARTLARDLGWPCVHAVFPLMSASEMLAFLAEEWQAPPPKGRVSPAQFAGFPPRWPVSTRAVSVRC